MGYTAFHPTWGRLDASVNDLGCGRSWEGIHRVRHVVLTCPECGGRVFARVSRPRVLPSLTIAGTPSRSRPTGSSCNMPHTGVRPVKTGRTPGG